MNKIYIFSLIAIFFLNYLERTEPITSEELKELFNSFEIKIPDDPLNESFASDIVQEDVRNLTTAVNSLFNGVVLSTNKSSNNALISEMDVVHERGQLCVVKKVLAKPVRYIYFNRTILKLYFLNISFTQSFKHYVVLNELLSTSKLCLILNFCFCPRIDLPMRSNNFWMKITLPKSF